MKKGFTLIELLVVIAIIGLLSSVVLVSLNTARARARDAKRVQDIAQIHKAIELYIDANGHAPPIDDFNCLDDPSFFSVFTINQELWCTAVDSYVASGRISGVRSNWELLGDQLGIVLPMDPCPECESYNGQRPAYYYAAPVALMPPGTDLGFIADQTTYRIYAQGLETRQGITAQGGHGFGPGSF